MHLSTLLRVQKWDVMVSVVLSRPPIIAPPMTTIEQIFHNLQRVEEVENSLLCNFELKTKQDEELLAKRSALEFEGKDLSELDGQIGITNALRTDEWAKKAEQLNTQYHLSEPRMFQSSDERSLMRQLDRKLVLIVKQRFGNDNYISPWILPQMKNKSGESLRQTAERFLGDVCVLTDINIYGNAPFAVHSHKYPRPLRQSTGMDGAKIFFFNAIISRNSKFDAVKEEIVDFQWTTREEFWAVVPCTKYKNSVRTVFLE